MTFDRNALLKWIAANDTAVPSTNDVELLSHINSFGYAFSDLESAHTELCKETNMPDDLVMRTIFLPPDDDALLRQLAAKLTVTRSDLIRSAVRIKVAEWSESPEALRRDLAHLIIEQA
jgi:hypothetical protein